VRPGEQVIAGETVLARLPASKSLDGQ